MNDDDAQCIGMARATGTAPNLSWTDSGDPITCSFNPESNGDINIPNAIDPAVFIDDNGSMYLIYGGGRIWMTELDPETGQYIYNFVGTWGKGVRDRDVTPIYN